MEPNKETESNRGQPSKEAEIQINPVALVLSVVALAGSVLIIIGGGQLLSIHPLRVGVAGAIADTYYHGLGLALIGLGGIVAATGLWFCFRSLGGRWSRRR